MKIFSEIIDAFIAEGYKASSIKTSGGENRTIISLFRKGDFTVAISCDKYGKFFYTADENGIPVSFHKNFLEIEKWKGTSYNIKKEDFQPSQSAALSLLAEIPHYYQISCLDFIVLLSQK